VNLLLDTHVLLWWLADDPGLGTRASPPRSGRASSSPSRSPSSTRCSPGHFPGTTTTRSLTEDRRFTEYGVAVHQG